MRKNSKILWLVLGLIAIIGIGYVIAETGAQWTSSYDRTNGNSHWLVDSSGYLIPGKDDSYDLGTSTYEIRNIYIDGTATIDTLTVDGAATVGTTLAVTGAQTFTGAMTMNNAITVSGDVAVTGNFDVKVYDLTVSSSTTSNDKVGFGGAFATFPTSGYSRGMIIFYSGGTEDVLGFYGSTATVTTASCWVRI